MVIALLAGCTPDKDAVVDAGVPGIEPDTGVLEHSGEDCEESTWYADADGDGHGDADAAVQACHAPEGYVGADTDCDDTDALDNDCNGVTDDLSGNFIDVPDGFQATLVVQDAS